MADLVDIFEGIFDLISSLFDFVFWLIDDLIYLIDLTKVLTANLPSLFIWLPSTVYMTLYAIIGIIIIYKILGK